jgi:hypothetical protein
MAFTTIVPTALVDPVVSAQGFNPAIQNVLTAGAGNGVKFLNNGRTWVRVVNKGAAGTITVITGLLYRGLAVADLAPFTLPISSNNDGITEIGPFDPTLYNDANGMVSVELTTGAGGADFAAFIMP